MPPEAGTRLCATLSLFVGDIAAMSNYGKTEYRLHPSHRATILCLAPSGAARLGVLGHGEDEMAICQVCKRQIKTNKAGKIARHGGRAYTMQHSSCSGSGQPAVATAKIEPDNVKSGSKEHLDALSTFFGI